MLMRPVWGVTNRSLVQGEKSGTTVRQKVATHKELGRPGIFGESIVVYIYLRRGHAIKTVDKYRLLCSTLGE